MQQKQPGIFSLPVIVGGLGFFVDIYDLLLFNIVRRSSFSDLGVPESAMKTIGERIISWQMIGLTIGGIAWGMLGDKKGRKSVLFGSILLYSLATIANGFVGNVGQYTWLRFIGGLGLAGELGASITLTSELLPKEKRGLAAAIIARTATCTTALISHLRRENALPGYNRRPLTNQPSRFARIFFTRRVTLASCPHPTTPTSSAEATTAS